MTALRFELTSQRQKVSRLPTEPPGRPAATVIKTKRDKSQKKMIGERMLFKCDVLYFSCLLPQIRVLYS